ALLSPPLSLSRSRSPTLPPPTPHLTASTRLPTVLHVLIAVAIAIPLYETVRYFALRRAKESLRKRARDFAEQHGVRVDLFKFGGKQLVREELLNDIVIVHGMMDAVQKGERPTEVRDRVEEYIDEIVPAFSL